MITGIRPEDIHLAVASRVDAALEGIVEVVEHLGNEQLVYVSLPGAMVPETVETQGSTVRLPANIAVRMGERLSLAIDFTKLHFFDPATTQRLI